MYPSSYFTLHCIVHRLLFTEFMCFHVRCWDRCCDDINSGSLNCECEATRRAPGPWNHKRIWHPSSCYLLLHLSCCHVSKCLLLLAHSKRAEQKVDCSSSHHMLICCEQLWRSCHNITMGLKSDWTTPHGGFCISHSEHRQLFDVNTATANTVSLITTLSLYVSVCQVKMVLKYLVKIRSHFMTNLFTKPRNYMYIYTRINPPCGRSVPLFYRELRCWSHSPSLRATAQSVACGWCSHLPPPGMLHPAVMCWHLCIGRGT